MRDILRAGHNFWCDPAVSSVGLLIDGDDYYRAFYEAAQCAQRYVLLAGWQFDSDACLLRGKEAENAPLPVTLLKFLDALCERNDQLRIYVLAWDFHPIFSLEREWMQDLRFNWMTNDRLQFRFDSNHVEGGSHHQKFVVIDGALSFLGGLDLCDHRWDDRHHRVPNPLRVSRGQPHKPFHDVQAYLVGSEIGAELTTLFAGRWEKSGGAPIEPALVADPSSVCDFAPTGGIQLAAQRVALSRTDPYGTPNGATDCRELCDLYLDAIESAEQFIYIETQYFSSQEIGAKLAERLRSTDAPVLEVIVVLNVQADSIKEEVAVGLAQAKVIAELRKAAEGSIHRLGIYYTIPEVEDGSESEHATYIHSKVMIVDDRFLTIGSANLTNRSTCVDTELNMSVETKDPADLLAQSIVCARQSLIAEHLGLTEIWESEGLVEELDARARRHEGRLRLHPSPTEGELAVLDVIDPAQLPFDPAAPESRDADRSIFVGGLGALWKRLTQRSSTAENPALAEVDRVTPSRSV